ncbi:TATA box-binding protein-associated factor RNA polymerase I subunit A [Merluccius polli]|uniref:TATA box-binding protein-associated factor RNA polymerase I subunit A n=1 Tax=Merluccius polli TaxID=89951 RepID=A0AA47M7U2_MERPO|nr:TATA box-binding protein-associated factor RNA polymerase I subunit A [Merluccius polli]
MAHLDWQPFVNEHLDEDGTGVDSLNGSTDKSKLPLAAATFLDQRIVSGFHQSTRTCLQKVRDAMLHHEWHKAARYMSSYFQAIEDTQVTMAQQHIEIIWKTGTDILHHLPATRMENYNDFYEQMKHLGLNNYLLISLEHSFHLLTNGQIDNAKHQLSMAETWRYGRLSQGQSQRLKLVQAYRSLLDYFAWCDKRNSFSTQAALSTDEMAELDMETVYKKATVNLKEILKHPGVWDPFILCYVEMLEHYQQHEEISKVLKDYAYDESFPPNPNAHVYLYRHLKKRNAPEKKLRNRDLQLSLDRFAAECEAAGMRISTSKSESMVLNRKRVECTLRVGAEILPQVEEFKYLGVLFTSEGRMEREIGRQIGAASAVMRTLHGSVVVKRELSRKAKLSIYQSIYVPALTYGHELWVMTERTRSRVQAMSFLRRVAGLSLKDRVRSSVIREELGVDPLLLRAERSQMRWLGHLVRMPPGRLPGEVFRARPTGRRPRGRPRTRWRDYVLHDLVPSHELMLEYFAILLRSDKEDDFRRALDVSLQMLDYACWKRNLVAWKSLKASINKLKKQCVDNWNDIVGEKMVSRRDWWPAFHFTYFHAQEDLTTDPKLLRVKSWLCRLLFPALPSVITIYITR